MMLTSSFLRRGFQHSVAQSSLKQAMTRCSSFSTWSSKGQNLSEVALGPDTSSIRRSQSALAVSQLSLPGLDDDLYHPVEPKKIPLPKHKQRILFLSNSFNSLTQRAYVELMDKYQDVDVRVEIAIDERQMIQCVDRHQPNVIFCPFLTKKIPPAIWNNNASVPCLVVHPGIHGDRGVSSIDWALSERESEWGVTVLQADEEMDAGDIWATRNFSVPEKITKSGMYGSLVVDTAMDCIHQAMEKIIKGESGIPLNYQDPNVKGQLRPTMKLADRTINFEQPAAQVAHLIRASDSAPGAPSELHGHKVFLYNVVHVEEGKGDRTIEAAGTITGKRNGAIRVACGDGSVWISHLKGRGKTTALPRIKLPSADVMPKELMNGVPEVADATGVDEITWELLEPSGVAILHFNFLNGAMSTNQCERLTAAFQDICARSDVKTVVLAGGPNAWSNGINLNTIVASQDPIEESWKNINAINDFVKAVFSEKEKLIIAALQGNAGAGGAMAALACDLVWAHGSTMLNPHYKTMGLKGSEYWTYFLPERVGQQVAAELTENCMPLSANNALGLGMIDEIVAPDRYTFMDKVREQSSHLSGQQQHKQLVSRKKNQRDVQWYAMMEQIRHDELVTMRSNFRSVEYQRAREAFVHKTNPSVTPYHLVKNHCHVAESSDEPSPSIAASICGKTVLQAHSKSLKEQMEKIQSKFDGQAPSVAIVMAGDRKDSERYVGQKLKAAKKYGVDARVLKVAGGSSVEDQLIAEINRLNQDDSVNGIVVQLPLPKGVNKMRVLSSVNPSKDVDGFLAHNLGALAGGIGSSSSSSSSSSNSKDDADKPDTTPSSSSPMFAPCTAKAILSLLDHYEVPVQGKKVCVLGRSCIVGMPTTLMLMERGATVTNCDIHTEQIQEHTQSADILVVATGSPELVKADWIKPGAVVVDVGFHVLKMEGGVDGERVVGDVHSSAANVASLMTPVPKGVGPMTVFMLMQNTVDAFLAQNSPNHCD